MDINAFFTTYVNLVGFSMFILLTNSKQNIAKTVCIFNSYLILFLKIINKTFICF